MDNTLIIALMLIFFLLVLFNQYLYREKFSNYLYPIKGLSNECKKNNLKAAFMPTSCVIDGKLKPNRNCKCINNDGTCQTCYPEIKKEKNRSTKYNPLDFNQDNQEEINKKMNDLLINTVQSEN